jgi:hypothetical protein
MDTDVSGAESAVLSRFLRFFGRRRTVANKALAEGEELGSNILHVIQRNPRD